MSKKELLYSLAVPYRRKIAVIFFALLALGLVNLAFPLAVKLILDNIIPRRDFALLNLLCAGLVISLIIKAALGFLREYLASYVGERVVLDLRNRMYWHLQELSVHYAESTPKGAVISGLIGDAESIRSFLFGGLADFIYSLFSVLFIIAGLAILDWRLTLISLACFPFFALVFIKFSPRLKKRHGLIREKYALLTSRVSEAISGMRVVSGFFKGRREARRFSDGQEEIFEAAIKGHRLGIMLWVSAEAVGSLGLSVILWFGSAEVMRGVISPGSLLAFYSYVGMLFYPMVRLSIINNYYQEASASLERVQALLDTEPRVKEAARPFRLREIKGEVVFQGVYFSYDGSRQVLSGIDLHIAPFEKVALVGRSGAGKTTVINLLLRFYDPSSGGIFIDGYDLRELSLEDYRSGIAMVMQDDYLFGSTIRENIAYGSPSASEEEIVRAAQLAGAHEFIVKLEDGYGSYIGERGVKLSCGQRQRISIARAILREPGILILDEATSFLDSHTEAKVIDEAFSNAMRGRTTVIITQRLSVAAAADRIVFIEDGRVAESGTHFELLNRKGLYWSMWMSQQETGAVLGAQSR